MMSLSKKPMNLSQSFLTLTLSRILSSWPTAHRTPCAFVHILTFHLILHTCWMLRNWSGVGGGCFSFECTALWRVYIYYVWLYLGSREYRLLDQTLRE